jgi:hypothetical protein
MNTGPLTRSPMARSIARPVAARNGPFCDVDGPHTAPHARFSEPVHLVVFAGTLRTVIFIGHGRARSGPGKGVKKPRKAFAAVSFGEYRAV